MSSTYTQTIGSTTSPMPEFKTVCVGIVRSMSSQMMGTTRFFSRTYSPTRLTCSRKMDFESK
jgi:hypothetical protein